MNRQGNMATENILIVDDDKNILEVLSLRLAAEGYKATLIKVKIT